MTWRVRVEHRDGSVAEAVCDQYCVAVWERWAAKSGLRHDPSNPGALAMTQLRVMAWAASQRDAQTRTSFEAWDATVAEVSGSDGEPVDPTRPATSAG